MSEVDFDQRLAGEVSESCPNFSNQFATLDNAGKIDLYVTALLDCSTQILEGVTGEGTEFPYTLEEVREEAEQLAAEFFGVDLANSVKYDELPTDILLRLELMVVAVLDVDDWAMTMRKSLCRAGDRKQGGLQQVCLIEGVIAVVALSGATIMGIVYFAGGRTTRVKKRIEERPDGTKIVEEFKESARRSVNVSAPLKAFVNVVSSSLGVRGD